MAVELVHYRGTMALGSPSVEHTLTLAQCLLQYFYFITCRFFDIEESSSGAKILANSAELGCCSAQ